MIYIHQTRPVGFFSSFNIVVGALYYLSKRGANSFYISWTNGLYQQQANNLFDTFFYKQSINVADRVTESLDAVQIGNVYEPILQRKLFLELNSVLQQHNYFDNEVYEECQQVCAKRPHSIGVHVRRTDHAQHSELLEIADYFRILDKKLQESGYDNIYLTTDDTQVVSQFIERYGGIVYQNENITRSSDGNAVHLSNHTNKEKLALDVMIDALSLANCEEVIITSSNIAGYVLMVNPNIKYEQIDKHKNHY